MFHQSDDSSHQQSLPHGLIDCFRLRQRLNLTISSDQANEESSVAFNIKCCGRKGA
jgi:hypothetical protein